ncbi:hypothetical protein ANANG_G00072600 [Anguilla anguilla]|uniref:Uncharacterized protein n=1 Tax=Anguilla anguilla TaxID=7936 RepID=A0A9D3MT53_ANGAN|nr:hypothetical protein ANANG_G00072600 [Anguilla anguilla]
MGSGTVSHNPLRSKKQAQLGCGDQSQPQKRLGPIKCLKDDLSAILDQAVLCDGRQCSIMAAAVGRAKWEVPTVWILNGTGQGDRAPGHNDQVLDPFTGELICALEDYPDRNASVSFTCIGLDLATTAYILAVCCTFIIVLILSSAGFYIRLKQRRRNQSLQPTAMVPAEDIYTGETTYALVARAFQPPPPSAQEKTSYRISQPVEMSTFVF